MRALVSVLLLLAACAAVPAPPEPGPGAVVERYYAALDAVRYAEAQALWAEGTAKRAESAESFARGMANYQGASAEADVPQLLRQDGREVAIVPIRVRSVYRGEPMEDEGEARLVRAGDGAWRLIALTLRIAP